MGQPEITIGFALAIINTLGFVLFKTEWFNEETYKMLGWVLLGFNLAMIITLMKLI